MALHWDTVTPLLREGLELFMQEPLFNDFRIVGGTALSLQLGHRLSIDIDLFSEVLYGSIDFKELDTFIRARYSYVDPGTLPAIIAMGMFYIVGNDDRNAFKLDLMYTDEFIEPYILDDGIRLATTAEIAAMKLDVVQRKGRKKDFWDIHELLDIYSVPEMLSLHELRYPYTHERELLIQNFTDFSLADEEPDPVCLKGKHWELIKMDIIEEIEKL